MKPIKIKDADFVPAFLITQDPKDQSNETPYVAFGMFTLERLIPESIPASLHAYPIRHTDNDWDCAAELTHKCLVNYMGTFVTNRKIPERLIDRPICHKVDGPDDDYGTIYYSDFHYDNDSVIKYTNAKEFLRLIRENKRIFDEFEDPGNPEQYEDDYDDDGDIVAEPNKDAIDDVDAAELGKKESIFSKICSKITKICSKIKGFLKGKI